MEKYRDIYGQACAEGDVGTQLKLYTKDARVFEPSGVVHQGHAGIRNILERYSGCSWDMPSEETLYVGGDMAINRGSWTVYERDGKLRDKGKDIVLLKRIGDRWVMQEDTFNSDLKSVKDEIMAVAVAWAKALKEGDCEKAASYFTPDCTYMAHHRPAVNGRKDVAKLLKMMMKEHGAFYGVIFKHDMECTELGDGLATLRGSSVMPNKDGGVALCTKYLLTFKRLEDGKWYIHHDMWSQPLH